MTSPIAVPLVARRFPPLWLAATSRDMSRSSAPLLPWYVLVLAGLHFLASLAHFSHNAEYLAFYPGMPDWLTRDKVYVAWAAMTSVGLLAFVLLRLGLPLLAILVLAAYGACGLDALAHYTLALCAEHTLLSNV